MHRRDRRAELWVESLVQDVVAVVSGVWSDPLAKPAETCLKGQAVLVEAVAGVVRLCQRVEPRERRRCRRRAADRAVGQAEAPELCQHLRRLEGGQVAAGLLSGVGPTWKP